jgi:hypothetical protein
VIAPIRFAIQTEVESIDAWGHSEVVAGPSSTALLRSGLGSRRPSTADSQGRGHDLSRVKSSSRPVSAISTSRRSSVVDSSDSEAAFPVNAPAEVVEQARAERAREKVTMRTKPVLHLRVVKGVNRGLERTQRAGVNPSWKLSDALALDDVLVIPTGSAFDSSASSADPGTPIHARSSLARRSNAFPARVPLRFTREGEGPSDNFASFSRNEDSAALSSNRSFGAVESKADALLSAFRKSRPRTALGIREEVLMKRGDDSFGPLDEHAAAQALTSKSVSPTPVRLHTWVMSPPRVQVATGSPRDSAKHCPSTPATRSPCQTARGSGCKSSEPTGAVVVPRGQELSPASNQTSPTGSVEVLVRSSSFRCISSLFLFTHEAAEVTSKSSVSHLLKVTHQRLHLANSES